jgi:hypothetical protein
MKFIQTLWSGRDRRKPNPSLQEKAAWYSIYPPHRNVIAAPQRPPVKDDKRA